MYRFFSFDADVPEASFCKWEPEGSILISWKDLLNMLRLMFPSCLVGKFASHMKTELVMILYYLNAGLVSIAKYHARHSFWRKVRPVKRGVDIKKKAESKEEEGDQILSGSNKDVIMGLRTGEYS
ncbi:hypothetical protein V6N11_060920 [Hibiscus sabdariffa]|uniref:Uncharacterized protein n=1 Tax=Hibiscus sabdariffa TaxID=183260 RepID=A0ABR2QRQ8_9ROSI